jgi:hypothetical protein
MMLKSLFCILLLFIESLFQVKVYCTHSGSSNLNDNIIEREWLGLIVDPTWNQEVQNSLKQDQKDKIRTKPVCKNVSKAKLKEYRDRFNARVKMDPEAKEIYKGKKNEWNKRWESKRLSKSTKEEKEAFIISKREARRISQRNARKRFGGFASSKRQRLHEIRNLKAEGKASEEDLKYLHDYQAAERIKKSNAQVAKQESKRNV